MKKSPLDFDPEALVQRFRPLYRFHSEEMWYPCHPEDQLRCADLVRVVDGAVVIPAIGASPGSPADQLLGTPLGLSQLHDRGVDPDPRTLEALRWVPAPPPASGHYAYFTPSADFLLRRAEAGLLPPYGWIESANFTPPGATWYHRGAPNNPSRWLGRDPARFAASVLDPAPGLLRGAWQEPVTAAWVQHHRVAGVDYVDLIYTCFLAWNGSISMLAGQGEHPNDVETVVVRLVANELDHPLRYSFAQHAGYTWYAAADVETRGERPVVYLARQSHECYPHPGRYGRLFGAADDLCDTTGVTWDAPAQYLVRPQGIGADGVDSDRLRCLISPEDSNGIILVPLDRPGPLWQYVRFQFLAPRPPSRPLVDPDFTHQGFPLATTKWWPGEGPAGTTPPLLGLAAEPSGPGVPLSFFGDAAAYLGPNPQPVCAGSPVPVPAGAYRAPAFPAWVPGQQDTVLGRDIGGDAAALAPDATFVDWRGGIGGYILGGLDEALRGIVEDLPDPLVARGAIALTIAGLHGLSVTLAAASSPIEVQVTATAPQLSIGLGAQGAVILLKGVALTATATLVTPVAIPVGDASQWYVPYMGPLPYSYGTAGFDTTREISSATLSELELTIGTIISDLGNPWLDLAADLLLDLVEAPIEALLDSALTQALNAALTSIYAGTLRVA